MGVTGGKQCTKTFLQYYRASMTRQNVHHRSGVKQQEHKEDKMSEVSTEDNEVEYPSRADEIEAWLKEYGRTFLGGGGGDGSGMVCEPGDATSDDDDIDATNQGYEYHSSDWRYAILDDRLSAAIPNTPLFDRFVFVNTNTGLTTLDADKTIRLLLFGDTLS